MITTTLNRIRAHNPCTDGWTKLLVGLGKSEADDEPLPFATILRINGLSDAIWATRCEPDHDRMWRLYAIACARRVQHLMTDPRSLVALDVAERFAKGDATEVELTAACSGAYYASAASDTGANAWAKSDKRTAAWAARTAAWAASDASAASDAASAARAVASTAWSAGWAASDASAASAARDAERAWQIKEFLRVVS